MLHLEDEVMTERVGDFTVSVSFRTTHGFGGLCIWNNQTDQNVTPWCFGIEDGRLIQEMPASIETLTRAKEWCEMRTRVNRAI